jgi:hypothetical protein
MLEDASGEIAGHAGIEGAVLPARQDVDRDDPVLMNGVRVALRSRQARWEAVKEADRPLLPTIARFR